MALSLLNNFIFWFCKRLFLIYQKLTAAANTDLYNGQRSIMFVNITMFCAFRDATGTLIFSKKAKVFILLSFTLRVVDFDLAMVAGEACRTGVVMSSFSYNSGLGHDSCRRLPTVKYYYLQMHIVLEFLRSQLIFFSH